MEMNFEEINFKNMVWFYKDELTLINAGENAKNYFTTHYTTKLIQRKIIKLKSLENGERKHVLTDETKKILESMR